MNICVQKIIQHQLKLFQATCAVLSQAPFTKALVIQYHELPHVRPKLPFACSRHVPEMYCPCAEDRYRQENLQHRGIFWSLYKIVQAILRQKPERKVLIRLLAKLKLQSIMQKSRSIGGNNFALCTATTVLHWMTTCLLSLRLSQSGSQHLNPYYHHKFIHVLNFNIFSGIKTTQF